MEKKAYLVLLGFEHPNSGHWQKAGTVVEMSESEATQLVLSGYLIARPVTKRK
ncbi:hypothetical protein [Edwardsiella ictaluri]|uniref:Uncharacterized protein n=1 Tax=Edwardsiella ictaluri TaxID=67780 RepID=A0ABY8GGM3_EDWIC|nr:hypothetical protein [Edwardsiella ictaluri]EKS7764783.1 hypothetical protein [Edwardsiella ictaluri]EKS7771641.1 hypothetical protein [Edwardsiella ictaluri]EKS7774821.1 hypothetical protein [Edwardsiella ictaluri]EKS7778078.1 hypothetical protein [Edwardsiella ictaluri]EKS7788155.1 hypothetical protein [Edwardsiella ictaluri]